MTRNRIAGHERGRPDVGVRVSADIMRGTVPLDPRRSAIGTAADRWTKARPAGRHIPPHPPRQNHDQRRVDQRWLSSTAGAFGEFNAGVDKESEPASCSATGSSGGDLKNSPVSIPVTGPTPGGPTSKAGSIGSFDVDDAATLPPLAVSLMQSPDQRHLCYD